MFFHVVESYSRLTDPRNCAFLNVDRWDDWGKYRTMFYLTVFDEEGVEHEIGSVKIGQVGLRPSNLVAPGQRAPALPEIFDSLDESFFSLGQSEDYYATLNQLNPNLKSRVLTGLRDCASDLDLFERHLDETVMQESLLRSVHRDNVRTRLNRLTRGDAQLTRFRFKYILPQEGDVSAAEMDFEVVPTSRPPTNVHVLVGRNGVGKTRCMRHMIEALLGRESANGGSPGVIELLSEEQSGSFAGLVLVSFSAFDDFNLRPLPTDLVAVQHIGLRRHGEVDDELVDTEAVGETSELAKDFRKSLRRCSHGLSADRWRAAIQTLEATDDLFADTNVSSLPDFIEDADWNEQAEALFDRLSSGHAIILLTLTRLVELVDENTLVLLDEPESHLHPPLLSAFIRCLSDLLVKRNGVAIIATHSPVVLQEVPRSCAWKIRRSRNVSIAERPTVEVFGENIGVLTREVFGFQVTRAGFHQLLANAVAEGKSYTEVVECFGDQLGSEARAIVQALIAERDQL